MSTEVRDRLAAELVGAHAEHEMNDCDVCKEHIEYIKIGWDAALANDERVKALVAALKLYAYRVTADDVPLVFVHRSGEAAREALKQWEGTGK